MIRAVVFDFGNVLCRLDRPACNRALAAHSALGPEEVGRRIWGGELERAAETGRIDSHEQFRRVKAAIGGAADWSYDEFAQDYMAGIGPHPEGEAALLGARELVGPVIAMTITLAAVYAPIGLQGGLTGSLFREFALTLAGAVTISGVVALTLSPAMSSALLRGGHEHEGMAGIINRTYERLRGVYARHLDLALRSRGACRKTRSPTWQRTTLATTGHLTFSR